MISIQIISIKNLQLHFILYRDSILNAGGVKVVLDTTYIIHSHIHNSHTIHSRDRRNASTSPWTAPEVGELWAVSGSYEMNDQMN